MFPVKPDGGVPIPPDVRERLRWNGSNVVMDEVGDTVVLRRQDVGERTLSEKFDWDEFRRHVPRWEGAPGTENDWKAAVGRTFTERDRP